MTTTAQPIPEDDGVPGAPNLRQTDPGTVTTPDPRSALAAGDAVAWSEVVARYRPLISSRASRYRLSDAEAADMAQHTWMRLFENALRVRDPERLAGWIATTASREAINIRKRSWREEPAPDTAVEGINEPDYNDRLIAEHRAQALRAAVAQLPPRERLLLEALLEPEPLTYAEISIRLNMPIGSIGPIRARALRRLRKQLHTLDGDEPDGETAVLRLVSSDDRGSLR
jgi:RNA polymerase sigma factor (sigma-70 family)